MSEHVAAVQAQPISAAAAPIAPAGALLQRTCACGQHTAGGGECAACKEKRHALQRRAINRAAPDAASPIVHEVLRSPGRPLDEGTRDFMESRFGIMGGKTPIAMSSTPHTHDFSAVPARRAVPGAGSDMRVSRPEDRFEREADWAADRVLGMGGPAPVPGSAVSGLGRAAAGLMRSPTPAPPTLAHAPAPVRAALRSPGKPVEPDAGAFMEPRNLMSGKPHLMNDRPLIHDFSQVRIHTGPQAAESARAVHARAYTVGNHLVFAEGAYQPATPAGRRLLAHELAHVVQQEGGGAGLAPVLSPSLQREDGGAPQQETQVEAQPEIREQPGALEEVRPAERQVVQRILISCADMRIRLETTTAAYSYRMKSCTIPVGSYETSVSLGESDGSQSCFGRQMNENDFCLDFGQAVDTEKGEEFKFSYYVDPGQQNPAELLREQTSVHVDVVERLPRPRQPHRATPACALRLDNRDLVPVGSLPERNLFEPIELKDKEIWRHRVPLGQFGWVDATATVNGGLRGVLSARYGPGRLSNICLTYLLNRESGSALLDHPLLGGGSQAGVTTYGIGGRARFRLPARASIRINGTAALRVAGEFLSTFDLAAVEGRLNAQGEATLAGEINGEVEIIARATRASAAPEAPADTGQISISESSIDAIDLAAAIGLRGRAGLAFRLDASLGVDLLGFNVWSQTWNLAQFNPSVSWRGGLKYSPNPGLKWDLGVLGADDEMDLGPAEDEGLEDTGFREDSAEVEEEDIIETILEETQSQAQVNPTGLSEDDPLPFDWHKPLEDFLYPRTLDISNAEDPQQLDRDEGPTTVRYQSGGRSVYEEIGVASDNWPYVGKTFDYLPSAEEETPEKDRLRRLLTRLGYDRSGIDVDHVHESQFGGDDAFDNLWPADLSANRSAGRRHQGQLENFEQQLGSIAGRWFVISRIGI